MRFTPFAENRKYMEKQYGAVRDRMDSSESALLRDGVRQAYFGCDNKLIGKGRAIRYYLENARVYVNPYDIFADLCTLSGAIVEIRDEEYEKHRIRNELAKELAECGAIYAEGDFSHTMCDWKRLFELGFVGILDEALAHLADENLTEDVRAFYTSVADAYTGIINMTRRLYAAADSTLSECAKYASENLLALTKGAPETLGEAMQLYFIQYLAHQSVEGEGLRSLGALDELLYPFYLKDKARGVSDGEIRELIRYFLFKWYTMDVFANIPFDIGPRVNELTYLILEEYTALNIPDPKIHVKCDENMPERVYTIIAESIRRGNNSFVFINDGIVRRALMSIGISESDAANYTLIGCYEPSAVGRELPCTVNGKISLPKAVELTLAECSKNSPDCFDAFYGKVIDKLRMFIDVAISEINGIEKKYPSIIQAPVLSGSYESCMARGVDIYAGGAVYNNSSICVFGIATFVDSLIAIKHAVYGEGAVTLDELREILENNWRGGERLRLKMKKYSKYGCGISEADELAKTTLEILAACTNNRKNGRGGVYRLGIFSIDWIFEFGRKLGASADGRYRGEPISKNLSSSVGMDKNGVTGSIRSTLLLDHSLIPDGTVLDISLHPTTVSGEEGIEVIKSLIKTYLLGGGFAIQMNIVSPDTLRAAQMAPDKYKNLQVRLCGWNVYFTDLAQEVQNNLIEGMVNSQ